MALNQHVKMFVVPLGVGAHLEAWGVPPERITELDWWETTKVGTLEVVGENVRLSKHGHETFAAREAEGKAPRHLIDAFKAVFVTGKANPDAQVQQHHIATTAA